MGKISKIDAGGAIFFLACIFGIFGIYNINNDSYALGAIEIVLMLWWFTAFYRFIKYGVEE